MQKNLAQPDDEERDDDERQYRKDDRPDDVPPNAVTHVYLPPNELLPATPRLPDVVHHLNVRRMMDRSNRIRFSPFRAVQCCPFSSYAAEANLIPDWPRQRD